jgi:hypothetical protein
MRFVEMPKPCTSPRCRSSSTSERSLAGRDGYDFYVRVPATQLHETTQRMGELEYAVREKYGVHFRTYAIATAG